MTLVRMTSSSMDEDFPRVGLAGLGKGGNAFAHSIGLGDFRSRMPTGLQRAEPSAETEGSAELGTARIVQKPGGDSAWDVLRALGVSEVSSLAARARAVSASIEHAQANHSLLATGIKPHMEKLCMKTEVSILHHKYPSSFRKVVQAKIGPLARFFEGTHSLRAVLDKQHDEHRVEMIASVRQGNVLVVESRAAAIGAALDEAVARMGRTLKRHKDKLKTGRRRAEEA